MQLEKEFPVPPKKLTDGLSVTSQIAVSDISGFAETGFKSIISNRPDGEGSDQPSFNEIDAEAQRYGLATRYIPVLTGKVSDDDAETFAAAYADLPKPVLAYCRTGTRSATLWTLSEAGRRPIDDLLKRTKDAGYDMTGVVNRVSSGGDLSTNTPIEKHSVVIVGGGAAGAAVAASLLRRKRNIDIAIIEPADTHYYQPGWTLVGGGVFTQKKTAKPMGKVLPRHATWIKAAVAEFEPDKNRVIIEGCRAIEYDYLVVCPGLKLDWSSIKGLTETLGKNGVTSNYRYDLAPYTWELVKGLKSGRAVFTQPPMPIKCAGAPQKAMYLSADHWFRNKSIQNIDVAFYNAGAVLFGVAAYVPALMNYVKRYGVALNFEHTLVSVDGEAQTACFQKIGPEGNKETVETPFDMLHVCPPQVAPDFLKTSVLSDNAGWVDVDQSSLQHTRFSNVFGLGDAANTPNAKTAAAARKQAPVVAENILCEMGLRDGQCAYDGYGSCPLTVERGKIVLAEFLYGGKVTNSFPSFVVDGTKPSRLAWILKERILPPLYWKAMLKGREWMAKPKVRA